MKDPRLKLMFLTTPHWYSPQHITAGTLSPEWYAKVYEAPAREMMGHTPVEIAEELLQMASSGQWAAHLTRAMHYGDLFALGGGEWVFVPAADAPALKDGGFDTLVLPSWPKVAIVNTKQEQETCNS